MFHSLTRIASAGLAILLVSSPAWSQVAPNLGTAAPFAVLGTNSIPVPGTVTCNDTGPGTAINGNVGSTFTSIVNNGCTINGTITAPVAATVVTDFTNAFNSINDVTNPCTGAIPTVTTALGPGVYCSAAGTAIGAGVTLTLTGTASDVFVFRVGTGGLGALTLTGANIVLGGAAQACNVFFKTAQGTTLTDSAALGTFLAGSAFTMTRGSLTGRAQATTDVTVTDAAPLNGCSALAPASTITVVKDFIPNNAATVPVSLTCTSGTVTTTPLNASEAAPAVFTVTGALLGATCTATETVPAGYIASQASCVGVPLGGSCTITNTLAGNAITVNKDFIPNSAATVPVSLTCTSGTVTTTPLNASEAAPAVFSVTGAGAGTTCTATETVPAGYVANQANCLGVALGGSCTIVNTLGGALPPGAGALPTPTLSEWAMILLAGLMAIAGFAALRRRERVA